jgi:hypothetical protein
MKARYFTILGGALLFGALTDGCSVTQTVENEIATQVLNEPTAYKCTGLDETAGNVPHMPNEKHCCMTEVEEHVHDKKFSLFGNAGDKIELGGEVPNYLQAELKAVGTLTFGVDGAVVKSYQAKHKLDAHCSSHTATDHGQCKPKYVRSRYDLEGTMSVFSSVGYKIGAAALGLLKMMLPINFEVSGGGSTLLVENTMSLCVEADHTDAECSPPIGCQGGEGGPGCVLTDAGAEGGQETGTGTGGQDSGTSVGDAAAGPCDGLSTNDRSSCRSRSHRLARASDKR